MRSKLPPTDLRPHETNFTDAMWDGLRELAARRGTNVNYILTQLAEAELRREGLWKDTMASKVPETYRARPAHLNRKPTRKR